MDRAVRNAAFTLVELLVVIAIISVLASMLLPVLQNSIEAARVTKCSGNLKQMGIGTVMYHDGYGGRYWPDHSVTSFNAYYYWADHLAPFCDPSARLSNLGGSMSVGSQPSGAYDIGYIAFSQLMNCPSQPNDGNYEYGFNAQLCLVRTSTIRRPSNVLAHWDPRDYYDKTPTNPAQSGQITWLAENAPHGKSNNLLWADQHVSANPNGYYFALWTWDARLPFVPTATEWHDSFK